jgi:uncharacterized repeat protein (TIGR01451 family)
MKRHGKPVALIVVIVAFAALVFAPLASAHHAIVTVSLDCNGNVTYTVTSWDTSGNVDGANTDIHVTDSTGTLNRDGAFNSGNGFTFGGSFTISTSVTSVTVTATAGVDWGDGDSSDKGPWTGTATRPSNCGSLSTTASAGGPIPASLHDTAHLTDVTASAGGTLTFHLYLDDSTCSSGSEVTPGTPKTTSVSGPGDYNSPDVSVSTIGTYYWRVGYSGDAQNSALSLTPCNAPNESASVTNPTIAITKTADATSVNAGDTIGYTITVTNPGTTTAHGVTLGDPLPSGVTWSIATQTGGAGCSISGAANSQTLACGGSSFALAAAASFSVHITAPTTSSACADYDNTATVTTTDAGSASASASIVCNTASIHITKTADAATVNAGDAVGFSIVVGNSGSGTAKGVTVSDPLPSGVTWSIDTQSSSGLCSITSQTLSCGGSSTTLAGGASFSVHVTATTSFANCAKYDNTASVSTSNEGSGSSEAVIQCNKPSISITKTADAASVSAGSAVGFTVTVGNGGPGTATGVTVGDPLPSGLTWSISTQSSSGLCSISGAAGSQTLACGGSTTTLASGATFSVHITATTSTSACATYNNTASVSTSNGGSGNASATTTCTATPPSGTAAIGITKNPKGQTIDSGKSAIFTIVVTNTGSLTLTNVSVSDPLSPNCNQTSFGIAALASMAPGVSVSYNCSLANVTASFTNVATATGTGSNGQTVTATDSAPVTVPASLTAPAAVTTHPAISIVKAPKSQSSTNGGTATFTITVTNTGDVTLSDVTVTDPLSPDCDRSLGALDAGKSTSYTCSKPNVTAGFTNVATATGKPPTGASVKATDHADVTVAPFVPPDEPKIGIVKGPKHQVLTTTLTTTKTETGTTDTTVTYDTARFTIKVTNQGNDPLHSVKVTDPLSPGCDKNLGTLAVGASKSYGCSRATVTRAFTNVATVTGISPKGKKVTATDDANVAVTTKTVSTSGAEFTG